VATARMADRMGHQPSPPMILSKQASTTLLAINGSQWCNPGNGMQQSRHATTRATTGRGTNGWSS
jgi:hypothetical protein